MSTILRLDGVSKIYCESFDLARSYGIQDIFGLKRPRTDRLRSGEWLALRNVSFTVQKGETLLVLGTRGSGKTTLAKLITGVYRPDVGRVDVAGRAARIGGGKVGMNPFMTVWEYVQLFAALYEIEPARADAVGAAVLEAVGLNGSHDARVADLSDLTVGYLSLGLSLALERDLYVFDGLVSVGDDPVGQRFRARLDEILARRTAVVLVPRLQQVPAFADRALILHDGEVLYDGTPEVTLAIYDQLGHTLRRTAAEAPFGRRRARTRAAESETPEHPRAPSATDIVRRAARRLDDAAFVQVVEDEVANAWRSNRPIVAGPYFSEPGFELLYWIPFLAWMKERFGSADRPVVALSRGRVDAWYRAVSSHYVDVFDLVTPKELRQRFKQRRLEVGTATQDVVSAFEQEIVSAAAARVGLAAPEMVHPSALFGLCSKVANGRVPLTAIFEHARYAPFPPVAPAGRPPQLPADYVAASFWSGAAFDDGPPMRQAMGTILREASRRATVVLLDTKVVAEDERKAFDGGHGIIPFDTYLLGEHRLPEQARAIGAARAFVGTFGGRSWMAPFLGVPSLTTYADEAAGHVRLHLDVTRQAFAALPGSVFEVIRADAVSRSVAGALLDRILARETR